MMSNDESNKLYIRVQSAILNTLQILIFAAVIAGTIALCGLFIWRLFVNPFSIKTIDVVHLLVQRGFGGVLILYLGLELAETLRLHFAKREVRLEAIIAVATIAVARETIVLDPLETGPLTLFGVAALIVALSSSYLMIRKAEGSVSQRWIPHTTENTRIANTE